MKEVFRGFHDMNSDFSQHFYTAELTFVACGCSTRKRPRRLSGLPKAIGYSATRTFDHSVLAQEVPSVGVQGSGVLDPRCSSYIPW